MCSGDYEIFGYVVVRYAVVVILVVFDGDRVADVNAVQIGVICKIRSEEFLMTRIFLLKKEK